MPKKQLEREGGANDLTLYKNFAKRQVRLLGEPPSIHRATAEFTALEFLIHQPDTTTDMRDVRERQLVYKLALSDEEAARAKKLGLDAYEAYRAIKGEATLDEIKAFSPEASWMYKEDPRQKKIEKQQTRQEAGKRKLRERLEQSYAELMRVSDDELRTQNSNRRVNFEGDSVYPTLHADWKTAYRNRSLTVMQYTGTGGNVSEAEDVLKLRRKELGGKKLIASAVESLSANTVYRDSLGEERFAQFNSLVISLLSGDTLSAPRIRSLGFDPGDILRIARARHTYFYAERHALSRDIRRKAWREHKELAK